MITEYVVASKYVKEDKLSGKNIKIFADKKQAIKHACMLMILCNDTKTYEVYREKSRNGIIDDVEMIYTTGTE